MTLAFNEILNKKRTLFPFKILFGLEKNKLLQFDKMSHLMAKYMEHTKINYTCIDIRVDAKIHTFREDNANRWKAGMNIHFVINNRTKKHYQFAPIIKCVSTQTVQIKWTGTYIDVTIDGKHYVNFNTAGSWSFDQYNGAEEIYALAVNDGFESAFDFFKYFSKDFTGKIIHWTNKKY